MNIKQPHEYPAQIFVLNIVGSVGGSIVLLGFMIAACVVCRRKGSRNGVEERNVTNPSERTSTSVQNENEYEIPVANARTSGDSGPGGYTVPSQPNIVYSDLDNTALNSTTVGGTKPVTSTPTEYAVIDHKQTTTAKQMEERHYANVNTRTKQSAVYANLHNR